MTPDGSEVVAPIDVTDGTLENLRGDAVAVDGAHADDLGVGWAIPWRCGWATNAVLDVEVVALFTADEDNDTLLLPAETLAAHTTDGRVTELLVMGDGSIETAQMIAGLEEFAIE